MSNFFEQELRKLFGDGSMIECPQIGRASCRERVCLYV